MTKSKNQTGDDQTVKRYIIEDGDWDSQKTIEASSIEDAKEQLEDWLNDGNYTDGGIETGYVDASITEVDSSEIVYRYRYTYHPKEPACSEKEHKWKEIHRHGHGGGVVIVEQCTICNLIKIRDTWADDGAGGHVTKVYYDDKEAEQEH